MDPQYLSCDELEYEYLLRGIKADDINAMEKLIAELRDEENGEKQNPSDLQRITRSSVSHEIKECDRKLKEISGAFILAVREADDEGITAAQFRLIHLKGRIARLKGVAPQHAGVDRLVEKVNKGESRMSSARDSLGSGEQISINIGEDLNAIANEMLDIEEGGAVGGTTTDPTDTYISSNKPNHLGPIKKPQASKGSLTKFLGSISDLFTGCSDTNYALQSSPQSAFRNTNANKSMHSKTLPRQSQQTNNAGKTQWFENAVNADRNDNVSGRGGKLLTADQGSILNSTTDNRFLPISQSGLQSAAVGPAYTQQQFGLAGGHRIRHWPLRFSGSPNGLDIDDFLFRVERQAELYGVSHAALVIGIGDLLTDRAAQWYWTNQRKGGTLNWMELRQAFLRRYAPRRDSDYDIRAKMENRKQRPGECFSDFCQDVEALSVRLTRRMPDDELVEVLRRNMNMQLRKALWREQTDTVDDLLNLCDDYEQLCATDQNQDRQYQRRPMRVGEIENSNNSEEYNALGLQYGDGVRHQQSGDEHVDALQPGFTRNDAVICWNCKDIGHTFVQCDLPRQSIFCHSCGMAGVLRTQCTNVRCLGNGRKDVMPAGPTHPNQQGLRILNRAQNQQPTSRIPSTDTNPFSSTNPTQQ